MRNYLGESATYGASKGLLHLKSIKPMSMSFHTVRFAVVGIVILFGCFTRGNGFVFAASVKKELRQSKVESGPDRRLPRKESQAKSSKSIKRAADQGARPQLHSSNSPNSSAQYTGPRDRKKMRLKATVLPKQDLSYHGMLEHPQRYDPSLERHKGGARNPQTSELLHEHFQELDKNHDGMLDPFERALGRLDMDRDLGNRRWE